MDVLKCTVLILVMFVEIVKEINCECVLSLEKDFGKPSPVYLKNGRFWAPNSRKEVRLRRGEKVTVACPGEKYVVLGELVTDVQVVEAQCLSNSTFLVGRSTSEFRDIVCQTQPWISAADQQACRGGRLYRVGYQIEGTLLPLYEACFNKDLVSTLYVKHHLTPVSDLQGGRRPQFIEGGLFGKVRLSELYKNKNQKARLNALLGQGMDQQYITKNQFLTRGHLAPRADFPMRAQQRATFHYVNTGPQWMRGNAGDWAAQEDALRRRVQKLNHTMEVYTGTADVLRLRSDRGDEREIYLTDDANNNPIVPVPMYFFKLVYDPQRNTATAFVSINSSFYNTTVTDQLTFCNDICDSNPKFNWLKWRADGGHSFCCSYEEFVQKVDYLPKLNVKGDFY